MGPDHPPDASSSRSLGKIHEKPDIEAQKNLKSVSKNKTSFHFAHPPRALKHKQRLCIRPRLLLQIRQTSTADRPIPVLDVLSSVNFAPKLAKRFPQVFGGKIGLGSDDVVIVSSPEDEDQQSGRDKPAENRHSNRREVIAAICQTRTLGEDKGSQTMLRFSNGRCWEATRTSNGGYDVTSVDKVGVHTTARWVPRHTTGSRTPDLSSKDTGSLRFAFSLISSDKRRHPIIATLTKHSIEVYDRYAVPQPLSPAKGLPPPDVLSSSSPEDDSGPFRVSVTEQTLINVDESLRTLIIISGIWVALHQGFSPYFAYSANPSSPASPESPSPCRTRSHTIHSFHGSSTRA
ncbi:MAG: hypothetical protein Q9191_001254 [Dirinaria sp. TL-2023a]